MNGSLQRFFVLGKIAIFILLSVGNILGQTNISDQTTVQKGKRSYLQDIEKYLPAGVEKDFFLMLKKSEIEHRDLIEALGLFLVENLQPFATVQVEGKEPQISQIDMGLTMAMSERLKLTWETTVVSSNDSFRILFFKGQRMNVIHPGEDCLIATTEKNFKIRAWSKCGFYGDFIKASVEKNEADFIFKLTVKADEKGLRISRYKISKTEITYFLQNK